MAEKQQENGPYSVYGRRTENEDEVRVGGTETLDLARDIADDMAVSGDWHQVTVYDRENKAVHVGNKDDKRDQSLDGPDPTQAE